MIHGGLDMKFDTSNIIKTNNKTNANEAIPPKTSKVNIILNTHVPILSIKAKR